jgi:hypothetical protein
MHWRERELYEIIKMGGKIKTSEIIGQSRMCKVTALKYLKSLLASGLINFEKVGPTKLWRITRRDGPQRGAGPFSIHYQNIFKIIKEFEVATGKKAFVLMCADDLDAKPAPVKVSLLEDGTPYFDQVTEVEG